MLFAAEHDERLERELAAELVLADQHSLDKWLLFVSGETAASGWVFYWRKRTGLITCGDYHFL